MFTTRAISTAVVLAALPFTFAQTFTDCNPLQKTCPSNPGLGASFNTDFTQGHDGWTTVNAGVSYGGNGAAFTITGDGQAPTIQTDGYLFFGRVDVTLEAAAGVGIVSSIVLQSEDLDEIDWEFLGGDAAHVQTNFFGKGDTSSYDRVTYVPTANTQTSFHTYSIDWTAERIQWIIDGNVVRTLAYADALASGGKLFPQTPVRVKIGNWVAGGANNAPGTVAWAGGKTDFSAAPFVQTVKSVSITNYNPGSSYTWTDNSGSWQSIKVAGGSSPVAGGSGSASSAAAVVSSAAPVVSTSTSTSILTSTSAALVKTSTSAPPAIVSTSSVVVPNKPQTVTLSAATSTSTRAAISSAVPVTLSTVTASVTSATSATSSARPTYTGAASSLQVGAAGSLLGLAAAMLML